MIRCLFEGRQHEYAVLHLCYTEPRDTEDFALLNNSALRLHGYLLPNAYDIPCSS